MRVVTPVLALPQILLLVACSGGNQTEHTTQRQEPSSSKAAAIPATKPAPKAPPELIRGIVTSKGCGSSGTCGITILTMDGALELGGLGEADGVYDLEEGTPVTANLHKPNGRWELYDGGRSLSRASETVLLPCSALAEWESRHHRALAADRSEEKPKGEFETSADYEARLSRAEARRLNRLPFFDQMRFVCSASPSFLQPYDADRRMFVGGFKPPTYSGWGGERVPREGQWNASPYSANLKVIGGACVADPNPWTSLGCIQITDLVVPIEEAPVWRNEPARITVRYVIRLSSAVVTRGRMFGSGNVTDAVSQRIIESLSISFRPTSGTEQAVLSWAGSVRW